MFLKIIMWTKQLVLLQQQIFSLFSPTPFSLSLSHLPISLIFLVTKNLRNKQLQVTLTLLSLVANLSQHFPNRPKSIYRDPYVESSFLSEKRKQSDRGKANMSVSPCIGCWRVFIKLNTMMSSIFICFSNKWLPFLGLCVT